MNRILENMKTVARVMVGALTLWGAGRARAEIHDLRDLVLANPTLTHLWSFEGADDAARRADKKGTIDLARQTTGGGTAAAFVSAWGADGLAAQTYRTDADNGSAFITASFFTQTSSGTVEYLFRPGATGGHVISSGASQRFYAGINDSGFGAVAFGTGTWPAPRRIFLDTGTVPDYAFDHWFYVAVTYRVSGGSNEFSVFVADLDEQQTTLSRTLLAERTPQTSIDNSKLGMGLQASTAKNFCQGRLDEVALYNEPMAPGTLQAHLNALTGAGVADAQQKLLVADTGNHRVLQYSVTALGVVAYDKVFADDSTGPAANRLHRPRSLAQIDNDIFISQSYHADYPTPRILRYHSRGSFRAEIPAPAGTPWTNLGGSILAHNGALYLSDCFGTDNIYKITDPAGPSPTASVLIPEAGPYSGTDLDRPRGIAFGPNGNLFVADRDNSRILEFQPDGTYVGLFASGVIEAQAIAWHDGKLYATLGNVNGSIAYWNGDGSYGGIVFPAVTGAINMELSFNPLSDDLFFVGYSLGRLQQLPAGSTYPVAAAGTQNFGESAYSATSVYGLLFFKMPPLGSMMSVK